ncbi:MAG: glycosyltransferase family 4 protein [Clostridiales bacterium]|nr:glycosyltransferase family 4 protein [Clostridiales bacterium]MCF8023153.1 glycosyltransferase family 4 protein [Clostridiales bacterium]
MKNNIIYILPKYNFFSNGRRGRVTHALGVMEGIAKNNVKVTAISGCGLDNYKNELPNTVEYLQIPLGKFFKKIPGLRCVIWNLKLLIQLIILVRKKNAKCIIIRYSVSNCIFMYLMRKMLSNVFWICEVNSLAFHQLHALPEKLKRTVFFCEKLILSKMNLVTVVSNKLFMDIKNYPRPVQSKVIVLHNASSSDNFISNNAETTRKRIIYMGILQSYYDFDMLIDVFKDFKNKINSKIELHIYGDGPQYEKISRIVGKDDNVVLHGRYDLHTVKDQINPSKDIFVLPYKSRGLSEIGSPIKLYEYMSLGVPTIAASVGQIKEVLIHKDNSYLYDPLSKESLLNCIKLAVNDDDLRENIRKKVRNDFLEKHTWQKRMKELLDVLENE